MMLLAMEINNVKWTFVEREGCNELYPYMVALVGRERMGEGGIVMNVST